LRSDVNATPESRSAVSVEELRRGWDLHVEFGLANPGLYELMYGNPTPGTEPAAATEAAAMLRGLVHRVAEAGRLRVGEERATAMIHAAAMGIVLSLLAMEPGKRDPGLSRATRESILATVTTDEPDRQTPNERGRAWAATRAVALKAVLHETQSDLTPGEQTLLSEWLDRPS
jgi:hypothetical protein